MREHRPAPPRFARWLLERRLPEPEREFIVGDLLEEFARRQLRDGSPDARRWFWREVLRLIPRSWPAPDAAQALHDPSQKRTMDSIIGTFRGATRSLLRTPALTALVVLTLAIGIGATTSVYSVARVALFGGPPFPDPDRIMLVWEREKSGDETNIGYATYQDIVRQGNVFASAAAMSYWQPTLSDGAEAERLNGQRVTFQFFDVLGIKPVLGRGFDATEDARGANRVVVLTHALWQRRFGADSSIVGRDVSVNGVGFRVAGVLGPDFESVLAPGAEIFAPLGYDASLPWACRSCRHLRMVGRLQPGVSAEAAAAKLNTLSTELVRQFPREYATPGMTLTSLHEYIVRGTRLALVALLAAVGLLVLIGCVNAAGLLLGRALRRESEFAVRIALGASRLRLSTSLAAEGLLMAIMAAATGTLLAVWGVQLVVRLAPEGVPRLDVVRIDGGVLAVAAGLAIVLSLTASLLPALALFGGRTSTQEGIRLGARSLIGGGRHRLRGALVATEVALSVMLLAGATLLFQSLGRLMAVEAGFATKDRLTMELTLSGPRYADSGAVNAAWQQVLDAVHAVPGVTSAALASQIPLGGNVDLYGIHLEDRAGSNPADDPYALRYAVSPRYLQTMGIPLSAGRGFEASDNERAPSVVILSEAAARRLFADGQAIGKRLRVGGGEDAPWRTVVGIARNTRHRNLSDEAEMQVYVPATQWGEESGMTLVVHSSARSAEVVRPLRAALRGVTNDLAVNKVATLDRLVNTSTADRRFAFVLFSCFAAVALVLAAAGLFGVLSAAVVERTREIGVRSALGATRERILGMVVRQGMTFAAIGIGAGLVGMWGTSRVIATLLYEVGPSDPVVIASVVLLPGVIALAASAIPAWRAARVDPMTALRES